MEILHNNLEYYDLVRKGIEPPSSTRVLLTLIVSYVNFLLILFIIHINALSLSTFIKTR